MADSSSSGNGGWTNIKFNEIDLGERIGGGGVGVIYKGNKYDFIKL